MTLFRDDDEVLRRALDGVRDPFTAVHRRRRWKALVGSLAATAALIGLVALLLGGIDLRAVFARASPPAPEVSAVADRAFLTPEGRQLFFDARPQLLDGSGVKARCFSRNGAGDGPGDVIPSGCFSTLDGITIFRPSDERLSAAMVTTAAHEVLHAAYSRYTDAERADIDRLVEAAMALVPADSPTFAGVSWSAGGDPASVGTERFAYLGSEITVDGGFDPLLEAYWARTIADRPALVAVAVQHHAMFDGIITELTNGWAQLAQLEQSNASGLAQHEADRLGHEAAITMYNQEADRYNALSPTERSQWVAQFDGGTEAWGDNLARRLAELDAMKVDLEARLVELTASQSTTAVERARLEALSADTETLFTSAVPSAG